MIIASLSGTGIIDISDFFFNVKFCSTPHFNDESFDARHEIKNTVWYWLKKGQISNGHDWIETQLCGWQRRVYISTVGGGRAVRQHGKRTRLARVATTSVRATTLDTYSIGLYGLIAHRSHGFPGWVPHMLGAADDRTLSARASPCRQA